MKNNFSEGKIVKKSTLKDILYSNAAKFYGIINISL
jgi:predicted TIM-barrel fold metal-dependent hydrolase